MNEQIKQLAEMARKKPMGDSWCYTNPQEFEQKFAACIIDHVCLKLYEMDSKANGNHNYYKHAALELKKHFGI